MIHSNKAEKVISTYLSNWEGLKYVHASYDVLVSTGRMSCFKPNLQNVPRKGNIRECFVPDTGFLLCAIDYGQLELCTLAQVMENIFRKSKVHNHLLEAINDDRDLHCLTASNLMGVKYEEVLEGVASGDADCKQMRQLSKALNFGIPGGIGAKTFVQYAGGYDIRLSLEESESAIKAFFDTFPEVREYLNWINDNNRTDDGGFIVYQHSTDRVRRLNAEGYCAAANSYFQGLAGDGAKRALVDCFQACTFNEKSPAYGSYPLIIIHDEIVFQVPEANAAVAANELSRIMINAMGKLMPDVKVIKAEPALTNRWYKGAEPVYDANGELTLWTPNQ
jgi:DNA polymerase-1